MSIWQPKFLFWIIFLFVYLLFIFFIFLIDFDGYYIIRTDEGKPRPKYIFNKCGTNIYFFTLQRFGPSPSLNFRFIPSSCKTIRICKVEFVCSHFVHKVCSKLIYSCSVQLRGLTNVNAKGFISFECLEQF